MSSNLYKHSFGTESPISTCLHWWLDSKQWTCLFTTSYPRQLLHCLHISKSTIGFIDSPPVLLNTCTLVELVHRHLFRSLTPGKTPNLYPIFSHPLRSNQTWIDAVAVLRTDSCIACISLCSTLTHHMLRRKWTPWRRHTVSITPTYPMMKNPHWTLNFTYPPILLVLLIPLVSWINVMALLAYVMIQHGWLIMCSRENGHFGGGGSSVLA